MVCAEHSSVVVALAEVKTELNAVKFNQELFLEEFRAFVSEHKGDVTKIVDGSKKDLEGKVSWRTFTLIVTFFSLIIGWIVMGSAAIESKVDDMKVTLQHCVFQK